VFKKYDGLNYCTPYAVRLHNVYASPNIIRVMNSRRIRWAGHVERVGDGRGAYRVLVRRPEGKRPLGRPRWEDNIKINLKEWDVLA
jgi:hypothetical protein